MNKLLDYLRRKELDKQARRLWVDAVESFVYKGDDADHAVAKASTLLIAYYNAFYPRKDS